MDHLKVNEKEQNMKTKEENGIKEIRKQNQKRERQKMKEKIEKK